MVMIISKLAGETDGFEAIQPKGRVTRSLFLVDFLH